MIFKQDIIRFFDAEAEAARQKHEELMRLPIGERIRKRKAIDRLRLDPSFEGRSSERDVLWKLRVERNLADFKEGEQLVLHRADEAGGIQCVLYEFTAEDDLVVAIYPSNLYGVDTKTFVDVDLILDKALVDMRQVVCTNFYGALAEEESAWHEMPLNHPTPPRFANREACERELDDTLRNYELSCTPRQREAILRSMSAEDYYLIQGPPGTGKSFILAVIILEELLYFNRKVLLVGPNHLAINNALKQVLRLAPGIAERIVKVGALYNARDLSITIDDQPITTARIPRLNVSAVNRFEDYLLMGLTPYTLFTSRARDLAYTTLVIDEAGQMTIPVAMMAMLQPTKIIMAGDHKQLPPIIASEKVPHDLQTSIFERIMRPDNHTMLDISYRMRAPICAFVSDLFYGGQLRAKIATASDRIVCDDPLLSFDHPVVFAPIADNGLQTSDLEAFAIINIVLKYREMGLRPAEIGILSPFRAQAANIRRRMRRAWAETYYDESEEAIEVQDLAVDTIDKMQGQEREVIILSLAAGDRDYMNEMGDFLYNPNKLNVAFSRAKSKLIIVGNYQRIKELSPQNYPHVAQMLRSPHLEILADRTPSTQED